MTPTKANFFCESTPKVGLGHFSRCLALARATKKIYPRVKIKFFGKFDNFSNQLLNKYKFESKSANLMDPKIKKSEFLIVSSYKINKAFLDSFTSGDCKLIVIDDFNEFDFKSAYMVINFTVNAQNYIYKPKRVALGLKYFIVKPEFKKIRKMNLKRFREKTGNILLYISGIKLNDKFSANIVNSASKVFHDSNITLVSQGNLKRLKDKKNVKICEPIDDIEKLFVKSDAIICGGGMTKYEAAYCCIPNATVAINNEQYAETQEFKKKNLTFDLGFITDSKDHLEQKLLDFKKSVETRKIIYENSRKYFGTDSAESLVRSIFA